MNEGEARSEIFRRATPTRQVVSLAKARLLSDKTPYAFLGREFLRQFAEDQGYGQPEHVQLNPRADSEPDIARAAGFLRCTLAGAQALWELINAGRFMFDGTVRKETPSQSWTTVLANSGGNTASWSFEEANYALPDHIFRSPLSGHADFESILDPDIFALEAGVAGAHSEVIEALQDAVRCLRAELYRPAIVMLGKAMEGAWIELGIALGRATSDDAMRSSILKLMSDEDQSIAKKIDRVLKFYDRRDLFADIATSSGIRPRELRNVFVWSDVLREARNAIHFGTNPAAANTYEKAVVLFLEGSNSFAKMYQIKKAADERASAT